MPDEAGDAAMLITNMFSQGFSAVWEKMWVFSPLSSVQLTALEAKLKTHGPSAVTLKFVLYTAAGRTPCWKQKWMSK